MSISNINNLNAGQLPLGMIRQSTKKKDVNAKKRIQQALIHDPRFEDPNNISVYFEHTGLLNGRILHIIGKVKNQREKILAASIAADQIKRKDTIVNELNTQ